jgi:threonine dehydrogenase-like Zn-dependent dehydrogenase
MGTVPPAARFVADNGIKLDRIFTHRWKLDQANEAYKVFDAQSSGKGVIEF